MKSNFNYITLNLIFIVLLMISCGRDNQYNLEQSTTSFTEETTIMTNVNGQVLSVSNIPLAEVEVTILGIRTFTNPHGFFSFENVPVSSKGSLITFGKEGYFKGFKFAFAENTSDAHIQLKMVPNEIVGSFYSETNTIVELDNGASIEFPANSVKLKDGGGFFGNVEVRAHWFDPQSEEIAEIMPGDLRGVDFENNIVQLISYGMMAVELSTSDGRELVLDADLGVSLRFPIPASSDAPESIPLWYLNEETGEWIEDGVAYRAGDFMVGKVNHFSFWNCDVPFDLVNLKGRLLTPDNVPFGNHEITIRDNSNNLSATSRTNSGGVFQGKVPKDINLIAMINTCSGLIEIPLGSFSEDVNLGDVLAEEFEYLNIVTNLIDCDSEVIEDGYLFVKQDDKIDLFIPNTAGEINALIAGCANGSIEIFGYDKLTGQQSEILNYDVVDPLIEVPNLTVCDSFIDEYIILKNPVSGEILASFDNAEVSIVDDTFIHINAKDAINDHFVDMMYLKDPNQSSDFQAYIQTQTSATQGGTATGGTTYPTPYAEFDPIPVYDIGDVVTGSTNRFEFVLKVDKRINSAKLIGKMWLDGNYNGVQDPNEIGVPDGVFMTSSIYRDQWFTTSDNNGTFEIQYLIPGQEYTLVYFAGDEFPKSPTDANVGSDETIDSDFTLTTPQHFYHTRIFILEEGEIKTDLDLGIIP